MMFFSRYLLRIPIEGLTEVWSALEILSSTTTSKKKKRHVATFTRLLHTHYARKCRPLGGSFGAIEAHTTAEARDASIVEHRAEGRGLAGLSLYGSTHIS
ncbi:hypothetical protein U9M48_001847 [Paspalum notatum var. saurae]|uniref:Uncharacterized protein n=1 Tax=Paspalum notatum var. saurae TaxID=547442 RepID=A0AAQ3PGX9_PASNO